MKTNIKILILSLIMLTACVSIPRQVSAQESNISFQVFYDQLSPYGQWIEYSNYGYVWIPNAGPDFVPYSTNGHWLLTDEGWAWDSDFNWGWAAFHYGRWSFSESFGWFWVPDNQWGPAWVNWRQADGYYGWSPMEPGVSLSVSFGREYDARNDHWMFVRDRDIERSNINQYYINKNEHERIGRSSVVINNTYIDNSRHTTYVIGPSRIQVQKVVGRTITPVVIRENNKPGKEISNGQLRIYRPQIVNNNTDNGRKPAPARVNNLNDVKRTPVRNSSNQNQTGNPVNRTISQPVKTVEPQNNSTQPGQKRNINQTDNKQEQQNKTLTPTNTNNSVQPGQSPATPSNNINRPIRRPDAVNLQNNSSQPVQRRAYTPQKNPVQPNQQPDQQRNINPQNKTPLPDQKQNVTPQNNNPQPEQQRTVSPQNNNPQPQQPRTVSPQNNNPQPQQPRTVSPQNNNQGQRTPPANIENKQQQVQPQHMNPSDRRIVKQKKPVKQNVRQVQPKIPDVVPDKK